MPYLLPRMHDRYFFLADILTVALAFVRPRLWVVAALFQVGSLTSYLAYFELSANAPAFAVLPITAGLILLLLSFRDLLADEPMPTKAAA